MPYTPLTNFAESASGLGALGVDGRAFVIQLITFVLVYLVLKRYAFKPIIKALRERREIIENGVKLGEQMQKEKAELEQKVAEALQNARKEADNIMASAQESGREAIREAEAKAKQKAESIVDEAERRIAQDVARTRQKLEDELVTLVADATEAVLEEKVDAKKDSQLIERALKQKVVA